MAQSLVIGAKLKLVFQTGLDDEGKPVLRSKTFNNISKDADAGQLFLAATAISVLSNDTLNTVERIDNTEITA